MGIIAGLRVEDLSLSSTEMGASPRFSLVSRYCQGVLGWVQIVEYACDLFDHIANSLVVCLFLSWVINADLVMTTSK